MLIYRNKNNVWQHFLNLLYHEAVQRQKTNSYFGYTSSIHNTDKLVVIVLSHESQSQYIRRKVSSKISEYLRDACRNSVQQVGNKSKWNWLVQWLMYYVFYFSHMLNITVWTIGLMPYLIMLTCYNYTKYKKCDY